MTAVLEWTGYPDLETDDAMALFTSADITLITQGGLVQGSPRAAIRRVWTDSRTVRRGDLFVALAGERFDGHQFVPEALKKGAAGALVRRGYKLPGAALLIEVDEPLRAFQELARAHRRRFDIPVVAVSGSNGKTTTKDMIGVILAARFATLKTEGNLNNHIGVPQTLLRLTAHHEVAVIEMGISGSGEMTRLCEIAAPTHGVLTNIGPTHLETLGDLRAVARAKGEMLDALPAGGTAVLNADDVFFDELSARTRGHVRSFGFSERADVRALHVELRGPSETALRVGVRGRTRPFSVTLRVAGAHNVSNALAAVATGISLGIGEGAIREGLACYRPAAMRSEVCRWRGVTVLKDCYNANPASMRAAIRWLAEVKETGRTIAVLGDMLELGQEAKPAHHDVGMELARHRIDYLLTVGALAAEIAGGAQAGGIPADRVIIAKDHADLAERLQRILRKGDVVLLKGSRGTTMERVLEALK
ncbi:MAG TPA: UDP-N-acetylmuramoyl-tripeptide--D-alanyl-D-alanine ligase [Nitrospirales bacterium]|jgi:UDP-N-acetylmuramoyl-tripeptide--D-alanyl-D-alanine ligase|nr:UDP-N-acetylmuramoyl-tripeptide--D-alanyl-D-alanine ligase [Nitrospirales bacterium]